jgi:hypothetical protein
MNYLGRTFCFVSSSLFVIAMTAAPVTRGQAPPQGSIAFVDMNIVPMDRERILRHQTLLVKDGAIAAPQALR